MPFLIQLCRTLSITFILGLAFSITNPAHAQIRTNGKIAFHSQRIGFNYEIYTMNADGTQQTQLTNSVGNLQSDWSSPRDQIVFTSQRDGGNTEIYIMDSNGANQTRLTTTTVPEFEPVWSPDGSKIAFRSRLDDNHMDEIFVMNADGTGRTQLTNNSALDYSPAWSPDGTKIAFVSTRDSGLGELYVMNADGMNQTRITTNTAFEANPTWSPSGKLLAFASTRDGGYDIYTMKADGTGVAIRLTTDPAEDNNPTWSPDGTKIAFVSSRDGNQEIYVMNASAGSGQTRLTVNVVLDDAPSWHPAAAVAIISEFRLRGPNGANDEFVEIYNSNNTDLTVQSVDGSAGSALVASDGTLRFTIPNGTVIPARGHYLGVNSVGYSLASYPAGNGTTATGDATYTTDIPDNAGIALFNTANPANFTLTTRLDAVGSTSEANTLYREGTGVPALIPVSLEYSFYRDLRTGTPKDTGDNAADFLFVGPQFTDPITGGRLGAPGPENLSGVVQRNATIKATFIDPGCTGTAAVATQPCPRYRDLTPDAANNSTFGTLSLRRRFVNMTGQSVTRLRFRVVDITTAPQTTGNGTADLRVRNSLDQAAVCQGAGLGCPSVGAMITINGTSLETPPVQPQGGGYNSTLSAGTISLINQLAPDASINLQFLLGVQRTGNFRFFINVEALPGASPLAPTTTGKAKGPGSAKR